MRACGSGEIPRDSAVLLPPRELNAQCGLWSCRRHVGLSAVSDTALNHAGMDGWMGHGWSIVSCYARPANPRTTASFGNRHWHCGIGGRPPSPLRRALKQPRNRFQRLLQMISWETKCRARWSKLKRGLGTPPNPTNGELHLRSMLNSRILQCARRQVCFN